LWEGEAFAQIIQGQWQDDVLVHTNWAGEAFSRIAWQDDVRAHTNRGDTFSKP